MRTCHYIEELRFEQCRADEPQEKETTEERERRLVAAVIVLHAPYLIALTVTESSSGHF